MAIVIMLLIALMLILYAIHTPSLPLITPCATTVGAACGGNVLAFGKPLGILRATATYINSYASQMSIFSIMNELERPTPLRMLTVIAVGTTLALTLYVTVK